MALCKAVSNPCAAVECGHRQAWAVDPRRPRWGFVHRLDDPRKNYLPTATASIRAAKSLNLFHARRDLFCKSATQEAAIERATTEPFAHPLDPLTENETREAAVAAKAKLGHLGDLRFNAVSLKEPAKSHFLAWKDGLAPLPPREATAIVQVEAYELLHNGSLKLLTVFRDEPRARVPPKTMGMMVCDKTQGTCFIPRLCFLLWKGGWENICRRCQVFQPAVLRDPTTEDALVCVVVSGARREHLNTTDSLPFLSFHAHAAPIAADS